MVHHGHTWLRHVANRTSHSLTPPPLLPCPFNPTRRHLCQPQSSLAPPRAPLELEKGWGGTPCPPELSGNAKEHLVLTRYET